MIPKQSGPADIQTPAPLMAPTAQLPPPSSAGLPGAPGAEPDRQPTRELPPAVAEPEPTTSVPETPANHPDPQAQLDHRNRETIAALVSSNDEYAVAINDLQRQVKQLGRNDIIIMAVCGIGLIQLGNIARKYFASQVDATLETAVDLAEEAVA